MKRMKRIKKIVNNYYLLFNFVKFHFKRFNIINITIVRITLCCADRNSWNYSRCISLVRSLSEMGRDKLKNVHEERIQITALLS